MLIAGPAQNNSKNKWRIILVMMDTQLLKYGKSHFTQVYVVSINHCRVLNRGYVHTLFQVVYSHRKEYGLT